MFSFYFFNDPVKLQGEEVEAQSPITCPRSIVYQRLNQEQSPGLQCQSWRRSWEGSRLAGIATSSPHMCSLVHGMGPEACDLEVRLDLFRHVVCTIGLNMCCSMQ